MDQLRNRTKKRQKEIDSIIGFFMLVSGLAGWYVAGTLKGVGIAIGIGFGIVLLFGLWQSMRFKKRMQQSGMAEIDKMTGIEFEEYLAALFMHQGYQVTYTPTTGDYGADLILKKDKEVIVVQAKRYNQSVGVKAVQEVIPAIMMYKATAAWVITNRTYTKQALTLAKSNHVRMIGRDELIKMSLNFRSNMDKPKEKERSAIVEPADFIAATSQTDSVQVSDGELMERLKSFRTKTAKETGLKAYHIFTNKTLDDLVAKRPLTINDLRGIDGLGHKRIEAYGAQLVAVINRKF